MGVSTLSLFLDGGLFGGCGGDWRRGRVAVHRRVPAVAWRGRTRLHTTHVVEDARLTLNVHGEWVVALHVVRIAVTPAGVGRVRSSVRWVGGSDGGDVIGVGVPIHPRDLIATCGLVPTIATGTGGQWREPLAVLGDHRRRGGTPGRIAVRMRRCRGISSARHHVVVGGERLFQLRRYGAKYMKISARLNAILKTEWTYSCRSIEDYCRVLGPRCRTCLETSVVA
jgi:hypothetical protein